jgi:hypothetical protein
MTDNTWLQTILQSHSKKNNMVLAQKQIWRPAKNMWWRKDSRFNKCCWENWLTTCRKLKLDLCLSTCTSINSKWIKDLNIIPETLQLVNERPGNTVEKNGYRQRLPQ